MSSGAQPDTPAKPAVFPTMWNNKRAAFAFLAPAVADFARELSLAEIADTTADFTYVRLMGTREGEPLGYDEAALDRRADQLVALAGGTPPAGPELLAEPAGRGPTDVFCFVIGGYKASNPAAAQALIDRVR